MGVPQGSPLSPVVFLVWMAPILKRMEERVREETNLDMEISSFVDDMCLDIVDWEGGKNMQRVEADVKKDFAGGCRGIQIPLETDKEEILHLRKSRKKKNANRKHV